MNEIIEEISKKEFGKVVKKLKNNKTEGSDEKDVLNNLDMYRRIFLSSTLYKILAKIIIRRITKKVTNEKLINETQRVEKFGLTVYHKTRTLHNVIEDVN
jgi:ribosomal protein S8